MSQWQMLEALKTGNVAQVIAAMEADEAMLDAWCEEKNNQLYAISEAVARELSSYPEKLEAVPW